MLRSGYRAWGWAPTLLALALQGRSAMAGEGEAAPLRLAARGGLTTYEMSPVGWWLDAGTLWEVPCSTAWYATFEVAAAVTHETKQDTTTYYSYDEELTSHNERWFLGIPARAGLGYGLGVFGFEVGAVLGAGYEVLTSDICSDDSGGRLTYGGFAGPVFRMGNEGALRVAVQAQLLMPTMRFCTNVGEPPSADYDHYPTWYVDAPNAAFVLQVGLP